MTKDVIRDRASRLFKYLAARTKLRSKPVFDIHESKAYQNIWLEKYLPDEPEIWSMHRSPPDEDDVKSEFGIEVIRVQRVAEKEAPTPPKNCIDWLQDGEDTVAQWKSTPTELMRVRLTDNPEYLESDENSDIPEHLEISLDGYPEVKTQWAEYLESEWLPWQKEQLRIAKIIELYEQLFELRQKVSRDEEELELIIASGLLAWGGDKLKNTIYRHLVTQPVRIEIEPNTGTLRVYTDPEVPAPRLETEMIPASKLPSLEQVPDIEPSNLGGGKVNIDSPLHLKAVKNALKPWANQLSGDAVLTDSLDRPAGVKEDKPPKIAMAPALILRKRSSTSLVDALEKCQTQIQSSQEEIPPNILRMIDNGEVEDVGLDEGGGSGSEDTHRSASSAPSEILFPLPSNDEQARIAKRIRSSRGVLVQGPPGTGKTHTIANLICHLLSEGKRILITSAKARPLNVLHGKLPPEIKPLCLTSLGGGRDESEQLKRSVDGILKHFATFDEDENRAQVETLKAKIKTSRKRVSVLSNRLKDRFEQEADKTLSIADGAYPGRAMDVIAKLNQDQTKYGWLPDAIDEKTPFPLDDDWLGLVSDLLQNIRPSIRQQLSQPLPNIDELMDPVTFRESTVSKAHWRKELEEVAIQITAIEQEISELRESRAEDLALKLTGAHTNLESARGRYAEAKRKSDRQKEGIAEREKALRDEIESERESKNFALSKTTLEHRTLLNAANRKEPELGAHLSDSLAKRLTSLNESDLYQVKDNASALHKVRVDSQEAGWLWPQRAISEVINRSDVLWAEVWTNSTNEIESLPSEEELKELEAPLYRWPEGLSEEALYFDAVELLRYYEGGGRNGWPLLRPEIYKRTKHVRQTTVDGAECNNLRTLRKLVSFLSACRAIESLHALWSKASKRIRDLKPTKDIKQSANALRSCHSLLNTIYSKGVELQQLLLNTPRAGDNIGQLARSAGLAQAETEKFESLHREWESKRKDIQAKLADLEVEKLEVAEELDRRLQDGIKKIIHDFVPADESPVKEAKYKVKDLSEALKEAQERVSDEGERRLDPLRRKKNNLLESLSQLAGGRESTRKEAVQVQKQYQAHRVCAEVIESIDNEDAGKYSDAHSTIADIESNRPAFEKLLNAINALKSEGKKTYQWLLDSNWNQEDQAKASDLEQAWNWSRAKSWFDNFNSRKVENIEGELKAANQLISDSIAKMCGLLAWRKCKERASNSQQQSLVAWELAVKRIRGGKGKHAAKHRRAAHQHMREAQGMIPALVSPLARLVESVEIKPELFDIVIVDEASQLGPEGMILFYLAKQLIVVGDHEQISPEDIGMDKDQVFALAVCRGF